MNKLNENNKKHGFWEELSFYMFAGKNAVRAEGEYINGVKEGYWSYYRHKIIAFNLPHSKNKIIGLISLFDEHGVLEREILNIE